MDKVRHPATSCAAMPAGGPQIGARVSYSIVHRCYTNIVHSFFKREVIISFSVIFGSMAVFLAVGFFLYKDVSFQSDGVALNRALISQRSSALGALAELKQVSTEAARYRAAMQAILVEEQQLLDFPRWIEGLARSKGLSSSFSFQGGPVPPSEGNPGYVSFSLRISGPYDDIVAFVKDIEFRSPRFLVVLESFNLRRAAEIYEFSTIGKVYFR